jgi:hypothetical protein
MAFRLNRRFIALVTAMLFGISVGAHGFAATHGSMKAMDAVAANDTQAPSPDSGCGGNDSGGVACFALCASAVAILPDPTPLPIVMAAARPTFVAEWPASSRDSPPEPAPPRTIVLG